MSDKKTKKDNPEIEVDPNLFDEAVKAIKNPGESKSEEGNSGTETEDFKDRWIRVTADFDNFRKRTQKEKSDLIKFGNENLIRELLPVLDNFERALSAQGSKESFSEGVQLIYTQLRGVLERFGLTSEVSIGKPFDPNMHEAMAHKQTNEVAPHTVVEEHQKMYFLNKKLIRPALVTVAKDAAEEIPTTEVTPEEN